MHTTHRTHSTSDTTGLNRLLLVMLLSCVVLAGCDKLGIGGGKDAAAIEADARATGSACRHSGRALEDCFTLNPTTPRAPIFSGWKEMNDYMRDNKIDNVKPEIIPPQPAATPANGDNATKDGSKSDNADAKADAKSDTKSDDDTSTDSKSSKKRKPKDDS